MTELDILFYCLATMALIFGGLVVISRNPIYSALYLVLCMSSVSGIFMTLNAFFIASIQLVVYAGAVLVLFVMVLMLFDLKREKKAFSSGVFTGFIKIASVGLLCGFLVGSSYEPVKMVLAGEEVSALTQEVIGKSKEPAEEIAQLLFTKYLFAFLLFGLVLLVVPIGTVALSRGPGGTHAE